jgi:hypothetical protein
MAGVTMTELVRWVLTEENKMFLQVWGRDKDGNFGWVDVPVYILQPDGSVKLSPFAFPRESTLIVEDK